MIETRAQGAQARLDVAQAFAIGQLRKGHAEELIPTRKRADLVVALIPLHAAAKFVCRDQVHQLCENGFAQMHVLHPLGKAQKDGKNDLWNSNRKRFVSSANSFRTASYKKTRIQ